MKFVSNWYSLFTGLSTVFLDFPSTTLAPRVCPSWLSTRSTILNSSHFWREITAWFSWIHNNFTNLISEVLINLFKLNFWPECFFFKLVTKRNTHADKRNNLIKSLKCSIFMFPMPNAFFEIHNKVTDLFISLRNI